MPNIKWLLDLGATHVDVIIFVMGLLFAIWVVHKDRIQIEENKSLWKEINEIRRLYNQVDKLTYGTAIAIQRLKGIRLINQSADGKGDHTLNRDIK